MRCSHSRHRQKAMKIIRIQCVEQAVQTPPAFLEDERTICKTKICQCFSLIRAPECHLPSNEHTQTSMKAIQKKADRCKRLAHHALHTSSWQPPQEKNHHFWAVSRDAHTSGFGQEEQNGAKEVLHILCGSVFNSMIFPRVNATNSCMKTHRTVFFPLALHG